MARQNRIRSLMVVVVIGLAVALMAPSATAAPTVVTWALTNADHVASGSLFVMDAAQQALGDSGPLALDTTRTWLANEAATTTLTISGEWQLLLDLTVTQAALVGDESLVAQIGTWTPAGGFVPQRTQTIFEDSSDTSVSVTASISVLASQYLAFQLSPGAGTLALQLEPSDQPTGSQLSTPETEPNYPVPELASLLLLGAGLVVMAGVVHAKRRQG